MGRTKQSQKVLSGYDYFETPLSIAGTPYIMTFDVEVYHSTNNMRTYRVINEMTLTSQNGLVGPEPTAPAGDARSFHENSIPPSGENINTPANSQALGAVQTGFDPYTKMANEFGTIALGENPARMVDVPASTDGADRVRRFTRTAMEAEATPEIMLADFEQMVQTGQASYNPHKNKDDLKSAVSFIEQNGFGRALQAWDEKMQTGGNIETDDLIRAQLLYSSAAKAGDTQTAMKLIGQIAAEYTKAGQAVQSARLLKQATPEGRLYYIKRSVDNLQSELNSKRGNKSPEITINEGLAQDVLNAQNDTELDAAADTLMKSVAKQIPGTWADKANAWRYLAMLGNPRTHIRNMVGNFVFSIPVSVKNKLGAVLESTFVRDGERTKAILPANSATRRFAKADALEMMNVLKGGGKFNPTDIMREYQDPFSQMLLLGRALNALMYPDRALL